MAKIQEVSVEFPKSTCELSVRFKRAVKIIGLTSNGGKVGHLITCNRDIFEKIQKDPNLKIIGYSIHGNKVNAWILSKGCSICRPLEKNGCIVIEGYMSEDGYSTISFISPSENITQKIFRSYTNDGVEFSVKYRRGYAKASGLTERQEQVVYLAFRLGYFDYPRKTSLQELGRILGIKESTLSEILRRALKNIIAQYFG